MNRIKYILFVFLSLAPLVGQAQDTEFKAELSRKTLGQNEQLRIDFKMNKDGDHFTPPSFEGFSVIENLRSIENSIVNGKRTFTKKFTFILQPTKKGSLKIGTASVEIDGQKYKTEPQHVEVTDPVENPKMASSQTNRQSISRSIFGFDPFDDPFFQRNVPQEKVYELSGEDTFITAEVSKQSPYVNESISVVYKIYVAAVLQVQIDHIDRPKYDNWVKYDIPFSKEEKEWDICERNGKKYHCRVINKVMLYPQKSGKISIAPLTAKLTLGLPSNLGRMHLRNQMIASSSQTLSVKELPEEGKPADFSGAVGEFTLDVSLSKQELKENETLSAFVSILGSGNFNLFPLPRPNFPSALDVYDPDFEEKTTLTSTGTKGKVTHTYTIIPQHKGKYPIAPISFSYFNPKTGKYTTESSNELTINVIQGASNIDVAEKQKENTSNTNFYFLKRTAHWQPKNKESFLGSLLFYSLWLLPILLIPVTILYQRWTQNRRNDTEGNRIRLANKLAKKYLSASKKHLGDKNTFYEALEKGVYNYLKAKLQIEIAGLNKKRIEEILIQKNVENEHITAFMKLLSNCEMARYAPYTQADMQNDYQLASRIISILDKQIR